MLAALLFMTSFFANRFGQGFLFGGSTGTVVAGARRWFADHGVTDGFTAVAVAPDLGERYLDTLYRPEWVRQHRTMRVRSETLDAFCADRKIGRIDLLKIDAQGADLLVMLGGAARGGVSAGGENGSGEQQERAGAHGPRRVAPPCGRQ